MKDQRPTPRIVICATTWSMIGFPTPRREWSLARKLRAIADAGFDGACAFIRAFCFPPHPRNLQSTKK